MKKVLCFYSFIGFITFVSCTKDKLPEVMNECTEEYSYESDIKLIIDSSCAYAGCHVSGFGQGNHTSYITLKPQLDNGDFKREVLTERTMPPAYAPSGRPKSLTREQLDIIACWIQEGYPEQ
jgi:hypothetical protein